MFYLLGAAVPNFDRNEGLLVDAQIPRPLGFWCQLIGEEVKEQVLLRLPASCLRCSGTPCAK